MAAITVPNTGRATGSPRALAYQAIGVVTIGKVNGCNRARPRAAGQWAPRAHAAKLLNGAKWHHVGDDFSRARLKVMPRNWAIRRAVKVQERLCHRAKTGIVWALLNRSLLPPLEMFEMTLRALLASIAAARRRQFANSGRYPVSGQRRV